MMAKPEAKGRLRGLRVLSLSLSAPRTMFGGLLASDWNVHVINQSYGDGDDDGKDGHLR